MQGGWPPLAVGQILWGPAFQPADRISIRSNRPKAGTVLVAIRYPVQRGILWLPIPAPL
jgi:hypothetical protein